jgi:hypothetical protein
MQCQIHPPITPKELSREIIFVVCEEFLVNSNAGICPKAVHRAGDNPIAWAISG